MTMASHPDNAKPAGSGTTAALLEAAGAVVLKLVDRTRKSAKSTVPSQLKSPGVTPMPKVLSVVSARSLSRELFIRMH